jgi:hypothetical protein
MSRDNKGNGTIIIEATGIHLKSKEIQTTTMVMEMIDLIQAKATMMKNQILSKAIMKRKKV